jgi:hypothetical protein
VGNIKLQEEKNGDNYIMRSFKDILFLTQINVVKSRRIRQGRHVVQTGKMRKEQTWLETSSGVWA